MVGKDGRPRPAGRTSQGGKATDPAYASANASRKDRVGAKIPGYSNKSGRPLSMRGSQKKRQKFQPVDAATFINTLSADAAPFTTALEAAHQANMQAYDMSWAQQTQAMAYT